MSWVRLDDLLPHHRKLMACGAKAPTILGYYAAAIAFASRHFTDGVILPADLPLLIPSARPSAALIDQLVSVGLWDIRPEGGWTVHDFLEHNNSADYRRVKAAADLARKRQAAADGNRRRIPDGFHADSERIPRGIQTDSRRIPPVEPSIEEKSLVEPRLEEKRREPTRPPAGGFDRFWTAYPNKVGKQAARKAWRTHRCEAQTEAILAALSDPKVRAHLTREGGKYIPNPATWLNQGRWEDEPRDVVHERTQRNVAGIQAWLEQQGSER